MPAFTELVQSTRLVYKSGRTRNIEWRKKQLHGMLRMLDDHRTAIAAALKKDLNKPLTEALVMEVDFVRNDVISAIDSLDKWTKPKRVAKDLATMMDDAYIKYEPFGVALILGAWNYPVQLTLVPMVGALAAGNCVILKPSEVSEHTAKLLEDIIPNYFDKECVAVVNGGVAETTDLLRERFDYIFYTGNSQVAKIIYEAASKYLTPVTLELGGKSPCFIDETSDLEIVARRLVWGRFVNAGQTCIAPDYVLCPKAVQGPLLEKCRSTLKQFYGDDAQKSEHYGRIVNGRHVNRIKALMAGSTVAIGGKIDEKSNYIEPTVLIDVKLTDPAMQEELFGPVLPIVNIKDVDEAIDIINNKEKALAMYIFSKNSRTVDRILSSTSSGGVTVNDTLMHYSVPSLPFGGVGTSGLGMYHGKYSFETFSHKRSCLIRKQGMEKLNDVRYPPYTDRKLGIITWAQKKTLKSSKGIMSFFPIVLFGLLLGFLLKAIGLQNYIPKSLSN